jgi:hypothetical protein
MIYKGLHLTLLIGPGAVPAPAPRDVLAALTGASVQTSTRGRSGFQLSFAADGPAIVRRLHALTGFGLDPACRVILIATLGGVPSVLVDGVITQHQHSPGLDGRAGFTVHGEDLCCLMDLSHGTGTSFVGMSIEAQVARLLVRYAGLGVVPQIIPTPLVDVPNPSERGLQQKGSDLAHIQACAEDVGYVFYLAPGTVPGTSRAYFGPELRVGPVQPALTVDMGPHSNVESLAFTLATQARELPLIDISVPNTTTVLRIPAAELPFHPSLGAAMQPPLRERKIETGRLAPARAALLGAARAARAADTVTAAGRLDALRYGQLLRARSLVAVRGASEVYDGLYFVQSVTTELRAGACTQSFSLGRSGAFSSLREVAP